MSNIYQLSSELRDLFYVIEEADGEITEEISQKLAIAEEQLGDKIMSYYGVIQELKGKNGIIKDEQSRLSQMAQRNEKIIDRLRLVILDAVNEFGYVGKTGNKKLDLDTLKLWTTERESVEIEDEENFNNPAFCTTQLTLPSDMEMIKKISAFINNIASDEQKEIIKEKNENLSIAISRSRLKNALSLGKKVFGAKLVKKQSLTMR